jgi:hypothetical protein
VARGVSWRFERDIRWEALRTGGASWVVGEGVEIVDRRVRRRRVVRVERMR